MKRRYIFLVFIVCLTMFLISFYYGYHFTGKKISKRPDVRDEWIVENSKDKSDGLEIVKEDVRISPNTIIEKNIYYTQCNHTLKDKCKADGKIINMTEKEYKDYMNKNYPDVEVISFSIQNIFLREERNYLCPNHYIIGESDGKIAIFKIGDNGEKILNKVYKDYPLSLLKEIDQKKLREGIVIDSEEELSNVLENFIS